MTTDALITVGRIIICPGSGLTGNKLSQDSGKWFWSCQKCGTFIEGGFMGDSFRVLRHKALATIEQLAQATT